MSSLWWLKLGWGHGIAWWRPPQDTPQLPERNLSFATESEMICGCSYIVISFAVTTPETSTRGTDSRSCVEELPATPTTQSGSHSCLDNTDEIKARARQRWSVLQCYYRLTPIFREVRLEEKRDPDLYEFFAFLQFPPLSYNWRSPTPTQKEQLERWRAGHDDTRPKAPLYRRTRWLADTIERASRQKRFRATFLSLPRKLPDDASVKK